MPSLPDPPAACGPSTERLGAVLEAARCLLVVREDAMITGGERDSLAAAVVEDMAAQTPTQKN